MKKKNTRFSVVRKGYDIDEVEEFLKTERATAEKVQCEQRERIIELLAKLNDCEKQIKDYQSREDNIKLAIVSATEKSNKMIADIRLRYAMELDRLCLFRQKWTGVYNELKERYHFDKDALNMESVAVNAKLDIERILSQDFSLAKGSETNDIERQFKLESDRLSKTDIAIGELRDKLIDAFEKKQNAGFSLEDATHPTESLEEICSSLGLCKKASNN